MHYRRYNFINSKMCFPEINARLQIDNDFRLKKDENYHIEHSVISEIPHKFGSCTQYTFGLYASRLFKSYMKIIIYVVIWRT